jgi:pantetheine-phosphate adenylyltransferase
MLDHRVAIYPGTFDPMTRGHEDLVRRASLLFERVVVGVAQSRSKRPFFTMEERVDLAREVLAPYKNVTIVGFDNLLMDFLHEQGSQGHSARPARGFRFRVRIPDGGMNRNLYPEVETVFLTPGEQYMFISATMVREIAVLGGDVSKFVHPLVQERLAARVSETFND